MGAGKLLWGYHPATKTWIPLQVDANGYVKVDMSNINLDDLADVEVPTPTDGYILYWDDATSLWKAKAIPPYDITGRFIELVSWVSIDGFTVGGDAGYTISPQFPQVYLHPANVVNNDAYLRSKAGWNKFLNEGGEATFEFRILYMNSVADVTNWIHFTGAFADPPGEIKSHIGWRIDNARVNASCGSNAAQTLTDTCVDLAAVTQNTIFKMVLLPGTSCKYYIDNVLKATHTTNLPTTDFCNLQIHIRTLAAAFKAIYYSRVLMVKEPT